MKKLVILLAVLFTSSVWANPAEVFNCRGFENHDGTDRPVNFMIVYSDWIQGQGYTNEIIEMNGGYMGGEAIELEELRRGDNLSCSDGLLSELNEQDENGDFIFEYNEGDCGEFQPYVLKGTCTHLNRESY
ncbi:MAG: hypothetical protein KC493_14305 [Bacteriovoracaceae bacterium]|nr:hypothetical protein [Bacteriovoracaceae bacterium]